MIPFWGECLRVLLAIQMSRIENLGMSNTSVWPVSPCKVRPCGLLCRRALFCEWWPWMPVPGDKVWGRGFLVIAAKFVEPVVSFILCVPSFPN